MSGPVTVEAPANIALVKYWGARDLERAIPLHPSISMTLRACVSRTTVEVLAADAVDEVWLLDEAGARSTPPDSFRDRVLAHLQRLRVQTGSDRPFRVLTRNTFPASAGMASSASGFAALAIGVTRALGVEASPSELSDMARSSGSGSAARSVMGGYVEWPAPGFEADAEARSCHAVQLASADHWDLRDVIALIQRGPKRVSSLQGHRLAASSPHFARRLALVPDRLAGVREAVDARSLERLGPIVEEDAIELHLVAMSSRPPIHYWAPATVRVLEAVRGLRDDGVAAWSTMDAGANVHVICEPGDEATVVAALESLDGVLGVLRDGVGDGPRVVPEAKRP